jgi:signal transduction histidine kinase
MVRTEPGPSAPSRHEATEILAVPDDAILRVTRRARAWLCLSVMWLSVLGCFVLGKYPAGRIAASAALLLGVAPFMWLLQSKRSDDRQRALASALLWIVAVQNVLVAATTGGLHSPHALALFMTSSTLYARHGWSRPGRIAIALFCGGIVGMAVAPTGWMGPVLADPWFTLATAVVMTGTFAMHAQIVGALRQSAGGAVQAALRARDELADQALSRARELELVGSRLSHELKNPLAAIKGLVQLAHRAVRDPTLAKRLGVVEAEVERMSIVLQRHLGFSRPFDRVERVEVDLGELADSVVSLLEGRARAAGVTLQRRGDARASVDPQRVRGALVNLVANAVEACPQGGRVEIGIEDDGTNVRLVVADTGKGMSAEVLHRIGTPFFTTSERGTGLGVVLARTAFEQHGGTLEYQSAPGQGTTALGSLPRPSGSAPPGPIPR